jgi:tRNA(Ile)-lysidine synthetase-like protein
VRHAPRAVARVAVRNALRAAGGLRGVSLDHVDGIVALAVRPAASGRRLPLPGGRDAAIHFDEIRIAPAGVASAAFDAALEVPGRAPLPDGRWVVARATVRPGPRAVPVPAGPLTVRTRLPGDRVRSAGREMSLKRFLADRRVPAAERDRVPVVAAGRTVVWVDGQQVDGAPGSPRHVRLDVTGRTSFYPPARPSARSRRAVGSSRGHNGERPHSREKAIMGRGPGRAAK